MATGFLPLFTTKVSVSLEISPTLKRKGEIVTRILSKTDNTSNKKNKKKSNNVFFFKKETKKESYIVMCKSTYIYIYI